MTVPWTVQSSRERVSSHGSLDSWRDTTLKAREGFGHIHLTCMFLILRCAMRRRCRAAGPLPWYRPTRGEERGLAVAPCVSRARAPKNKAWAKKRTENSNFHYWRPSGRYVTNFWFSELVNLTKRRLIGDLSGQPKARVKSRPVCALHD